MYACLADTRYARYDMCRIRMHTSALRTTRCVCVCACATCVNICGCMCMKKCNQGLQKVVAFHKGHIHHKSPLFLPRGVLKSTLYSWAVPRISRAAGPAFSFLERFHFLACYINIFRCSRNDCPSFLLFLYYHIYFACFFSLRAYVTDPLPERRGLPNENLRSENSCVWNATLI